LNVFSRQYREDININSGPHDASVDLSNKQAGGPPPPPPPVVNAATLPKVNPDRNALLDAIRQGATLKPVKKAEEKVGEKPKKKSEEKTVAIAPKNAGGIVGALQDSSMLHEDPVKYVPPTEEANADEWSDNKSSSSEESEEESIVPSSTQQAAAASEPTDLLSALTAHFKKTRKAINGKDDQHKQKDMEKGKGIEKLKSKPPLPPRPAKEEKSEKNKAADASAALTVVIPPHLSPEEELFPSPPPPLLPEMRGTRRSSSNEELPPPPPLSPLLPKKDMPSPGKKFKEDSPNLAETLRAGITFTQEEQPKEEDEKAHTLAKSLNDLLTAFSAKQVDEVRAIQNKLLETVNPTAKGNDEMSTSKSLNDLSQMQGASASVLTEDRGAWKGMLLKLYSSKGRIPSQAEVTKFARKNIPDEESAGFRIFARTEMKYS